MADWPKTGDTDWNTKMLAYLAIEHNTDGTHKSGFQDRGDPSSFDYRTGDLTKDATWRDLDLGTDVSVPTKVTAVLLGLSVKAAAGSFVQFRKNGNSNTFNVAFVTTQVTAHTMSADVVVPCDSSQVIEYLASAVTFGTLDIIVKGWWI